MDSNLKRRRGAPFGNQNARKHGYYSRALKDSDKKDLKEAASVEGVDEEIALLRFKLKSLLSQQSVDIRLIEQAVGALNRLIRTRHKISPLDAKGLKKAIGNVLREVAVPLGIGIDTVLNRNKDKQP